MKTLTTLLSALFAATAVSAHGSLASVELSGKTYTGPSPAEGNAFTVTDSPVREIALLEPITDVTSPAMLCGWNPAPSAKLIAPVTAGSEFSITMRGGTGGPWPHEYGPVTFYLGKCSGAADKCDPTSLKWFKIAELGLKTPGTNEWWQEDLMNGKAVTATMPAGIANGDYLLRTEVMAVHNAMNLGGAELFVSCGQITVSGGGGALPPASDLVSFPGAYKATDPGIHVDIWNNFASYTFPGPAVFTGKGGSTQPTPPPSNPSKPAPSDPVNAAPAPSPSSPTGPKKTCSRRARRSRRNHRRASLHRFDQSFVM